MKAWFKVHSSLERLNGNPRFAYRLASALHDEARLFESPEKQMQAWKDYMEAMQDAHIFEFDDDVSLLMTLTDNIPHEIKLPFPIVWLDVEFDVMGKYKREHIIGILLYDEGFPIIKHEDERIEILKDTKPAIAFLEDRTHNIMVELITPIGENLSSFKFTNLGKVEHNTISNMVYNFLDLLETPDIMIVPIKRKRITKKYFGDEIKITDKVVIRASIRRYIDELKSGGMFHYSHRFWVRGHWRHYRNEKYIHMIGKREWIKPFIKGEGILIKKTYVIPDDKREPEEL